MLNETHLGADGADSSCTRVGIDRRQLEPGDAGIRQTAYVMRDLIRQGAAHPVVREHAELAVLGLGPKRQLGQALAIRDWVRDHAEYLRDSFRVEWLQTPWYVLTCKIDRGYKAQLDCDDLTDLSLSMLASIGFPTKIRVVSTRPDGQYNHVYGAVRVGSQWWKLDMTKAWDVDEAGRPEVRAFEIEV